MSENRTEVAPRDLTPRMIVSELDRYIVGQSDAKRAVAIALRNRWRRMEVTGDLRDEIIPNNIIMIGPTGVGKTEIARRLARLAGSPFVKVEATKFTERGYVGRDVESMIRDLVEASVKMVREELAAEVEGVAAQAVEEALLDLLLPPLRDTGEDTAARYTRSREALRDQLRRRELEERTVTIEATVRGGPMIDIMQSGGDELGAGLGEALKNMLPSRKKERSVSLRQAREILLQDELDRRIDQDRVATEALARAETSGIVFLDEIDKVASRGEMHGADVSREGVQRDLLPIVEGAAVQTKYGPLKTDHILFVAAGAFHMSKPSDLIPELQGRFPIRVELKSLTEADFVRILAEPETSLPKQYQALLATENCTLEFTEDGFEELARIAHDVNTRQENIGARRLHTILTTLLDDMLFELPPEGDERPATHVRVDGEFVREKLGDLVKDEDLSRYIL